MLDQIHDPRNLGAVIRTANATDADGVLIPKNNSQLISLPLFTKQQQEALNIPQLSKVTNLAQTIEKLKSVGIWVVGTAEDAEMNPITSADFTVPLCVVLGNEGEGITATCKTKM